jgi:S1-C subfamily serine protease
MSDDYPTSPNHSENHDAGERGLEQTAAAPSAPHESSDPAVAEGASAAPTPRRRRGLGLAAAAVAGTLVVGGAGAGLGIAWDHSRANDPATTAASGEVGSASPFGGFTIRPGTGGSIFGGLPDSVFGDGQSGAQLQSATADQLTGLVRIVSTIDYGVGKAIGTGLVLTSDGEIVTNHHVVAGATSIRVIVESTGQSYTAKVVGADAKDDVAVLQLEDASGLTTAPLTQVAAQVGDAVTAVGDADGRHRLSAVTGRVTAVRQSITTRGDATTSGERLRGLIEIDADVISGDSGGATLNAAGQVVGMTTAASSGSANITGYAIPIAKVVRIGDAIESGTDTGRIDLGYPAFLGVQLSGQSTRVAGTVAGSAAAGTGIRAGDSVTAVDGVAVRKGAQLRAAVAAHAPGDQVSISWTDTNGDSHTATVTLGEGPVE